MTFEDVRYVVYGLVTIGVGIVAILQSKQNKRVKRIQEQVENNHVDDNGNPINMREEQDERHDENTKTLKTIILKLDRTNEKLEHQNDKIDHVNKKVDKLYGKVDNNNDRIEDIEDTLNPKKENENDNRKP